MSRDALHHLVDRIPAEELSAAQRFLEYLAVNQPYRTVLSASADDEHVTDGDAKAIAQAQDDVRSGKISSHDEILREFGLR